MTSMRIPFDQYQIPSLEEDLRVLDLLPKGVASLQEDASAQTEAKSKKADKSYDYGNKMDKESDEDEDEEDAEDEDDDEEETDEAEDAAYGLLEAFTGLSDEDVDNLSEEQLEAVDRAIGMTEGLAEAIQKRTKGERKIAQKTKKIGHDAGETKGAHKLMLRKAAKERRKDVRGKRKKARYSRRPDVKRRAAQLGNSTDALDNIIERLNQLTGPLTQEHAETGEISDKIVDGLKAVYEKADEIAHAIASDLSESDNEIDEDAPSYKLGVYFETLANDARGLLNAIFAEDCEIPMEDAIEDLHSMTSDLNKGLAKAGRIN